MVRNIQEIKNPGASNHFEQLVGKCLGLLHSIVTQTSKVLGMRALQSWNSAGATAWALKSADSKFTTFLADKILAEYSTSGTFSSTDLLDSLGTSIVVSDRLTFPVKYREFHKLVSGP